MEERDGCEREDFNVLDTSNDTVKESQRSFLLNTLLCEGDHQSTGPPRATSARTVQLEVGNRRLKAALKIPAKTRVTPHLIFLRGVESVGLQEEKGGPVGCVPPIFQDP